jgi:hypothetical protein
MADVAAVLLPVTTFRVLGATATVTTSALSGLEIGGSLAGILSGLAAVVSLVLFIGATNRKNKRDYDNEIRDAEARGRAIEKERADMEIRRSAERLAMERELKEQALADSAYWRSLAFGPPHVASREDTEDHR